MEFSDSEEEDEAPLQEKRHWAMAHIVSFIAACAGVTFNLLSDNENLQAPLSAGFGALFACQICALTCCSYSPGTSESEQNKKKHSQMHSIMVLSRSLISGWTLGTLTTLAVGWYLELDDQYPGVKLYGSVINVLLSILSVYLLWKWQDSNRRDGSLTEFTMTHNTSVDFQRRDETTLAILSNSADCIGLASGALLLITQNPANNFFPYPLPMIGIIAATGWASLDLCLFIYQ